MTLRHTLLGLLTHGPMTGYDLKRHFDGTIALFWNADQAQVYRALAKLADDGLVDIEIVPQDGRPNRRVHRIVAAGRDELRRWLASPLAAEPVRDPFLARLFFADELGSDELLGLLERHRADVVAKLTTLEEVATSDRDRAPTSPDLRRTLRLATLANGIRHLRAEVEWLDEVAATVERVER